MKKVTSYLLFFIFTLLSLSCEDNNSPNLTENMSNNSLQKATLLYPCANNDYPPTNSGTYWQIEWCASSGEVYLRDEACFIWSNIVDSPGGYIPVDYYDCDFPPDYFDAPKATILTVTRLYQPAAELNWSFVWCDWYVAQVKIGNGTWNPISQSDNQYGSGSQTAQYWITPTSELISFRVQTKIGNAITNSNVVSFYY